MEIFICIIVVKMLLWLSMIMIRLLSTMLYALEKITTMVNVAGDFVWGVSLIASILVTGILLSCMLRFSHTFNGLMAFPNLVALVLLSPIVARTTHNYLHRLKMGVIEDK